MKRQNRGHILFAFSVILFVENNLLEFGEKVFPWFIYYCYSDYSKVLLAFSYHKFVSKYHFPFSWPMTYKFFLLTFSWDTILRHSFNQITTWLFVRLATPDQCLREVFQQLISNISSRLSYWLTCYYWAAPIWLKQARRSLIRCLFGKFTLAGQELTSTLWVTA